jgi:hypothetical protein
MHNVLSVLGTLGGQQFTGTATLAMCDVCDLNVIFASQDLMPFTDL